MINERFNSFYNLDYTCRYDFFMYQNLTPVSTVIHFPSKSRNFGKINFSVVKRTTETLLRTITIIIIINNDRCNDYSNNQVRITLIKRRKKVHAPSFVTLF